MSDGATPGTDPFRRVVEDALWALVTGELRSIDTFAPDVVAKSRFLTASNRCELVDQIDDRRGTLSNVELVIDRMERDGTGVEIAWRFTGDHTGPALLNEDELYEPTGRRIGTAIITHLGVGDGCITSMRHEFDVAALCRGDCRGDPPDLDERSQDEEA